MENLTYTKEGISHDVFQRYFNQVMQDKPKPEQLLGPYISISRDFGCGANIIAERLAAELNKVNKSKGINTKWNWLNKSILEESAKALGLSKSKIKYVFNSEKKTTMDEIVGALSTKYFKNDRTIRNTIIQVIEKICRSGHVIIVGRGGIAFKHVNPRSLHIKLTAPIEWRVDKICENYGKSPVEAIKYINKVDTERQALINSFVGSQSSKPVFDLVFNRQSITENEIVSIILHLVNARKLYE